VRVDRQKGELGFFLHAEGIRESLDAFAIHVENTKKVDLASPAELAMLTNTQVITTETFRLPMDRGIASYLIQRISRLTNTFLEPVDEDRFTVRTSF
jgi:hypothetical protein